MDLNNYKKIYFVGIKGVAMAALAVWAVEAHKKVAGSDTIDEFPTTEIFNKIKIIPKVGFFEKNINDFKPDLVIYTGAHGGITNPEVQEAVRLNIPVLPQGKALGLAMKGLRQISVAGSHGKTTTSAMIATILAGAGLDPSYAIGAGEIFGLGLPGHCGKGKFFVAEADEYVTDPTHDLTPRFLWQHPDCLVVTNVDYDHPDVYRSLLEVQAAFQKLQNQQTGKRITIVNIDNPASKFLLKSNEGLILTYGFSPSANYQIKRVSYGDERTFIQITNGSNNRELTLKVPGKHNAVNAVAAVTACESLGIEWDAIKKGLLTFGGTKRRIEKIAEVNGVYFYDDYAHHPAEISASIEALRGWYPQKRLIIVFQPHTYSRTKALLPDFARSLSKADVPILTDIYASAREHDTLGISGETLAQATADLNIKTYYAEGKDNIAKYLKNNLKSDDLVVFMGAGSIYNWSQEIVKLISLQK